MLWGRPCGGAGCGVRGAGDAHASRVMRHASGRGAWGAGRARVTRHSSRVMKRGAGVARQALGTGPLWLLPRAAPEIRCKKQPLQSLQRK